MQETADFLIVGQGIAGILVAFELINTGYSCLLLDHEKPHSSSLSAAALLSPVNLNAKKAFDGQQQDLQIALNTYRELETFLDLQFVEKLPLIVLEDDNFIKGNHQDYLTQPLSNLDWQKINNYFHLSKIKPFLLQENHRIRFEKLRKAWMCYWQQKGSYFQEDFDYSGCQINNGSIRYKAFKVQHIIFAEGAAGSKNPYFPQLPFTPNMGNILQLSIPDLPEQWGYHFQRKKLLPLGKRQFWLGSNYQWKFDKPQPNPEWQQESIKQLEALLRTPFKIVNHFVAQRPTTAGQKPLLLQNGEYPSLYFFNGLGTRGFSIGPVMAKRFVEQFNFSRNNHP